MIAAGKHKVFIYLNGPLSNFFAQSLLFFSRMSQKFSSILGFANKGDEENAN
ncbi:hypothetical protein [Domibacillus robiginosus]|uniref:hypothetical protein n=1 Tax=Domibacillus robiginosus TaxID=1071054 RepID=UPI000B2AA966|nr:hypothetical protein [Domibacillus robiginosus]